jgi:hypothetical protein
VYEPPRDKVEGVFAEGVTMSSAERVDKVRFCLVNFPSYLGKPIMHKTITPRKSSRGRLELQAPGLLCTVDVIPEVEELKKALDRSAGFLISHVGELRKCQGTFTPREIEVLLIKLHWFFGFLSGAWSGPIFPQGFTGDTKTWEQLAPWRISDPRRLPNWLPLASPPELSQLFAGFLEKCSDPSWESPLRTIVGWYVQANSSAAMHETKLIIGQVALELIAWVEIVETRRLHSRTHFKSLPAADRIRSLLDHLNIPAGVPSHCPELLSLQKGDAFDGPGVLVRLRNALVHATRKSLSPTASLSGIALWQAGQLALQYVELAVLALCGYQGKYTRRTWSGWRFDAEVPVPWTTNQPPATENPERL